MAVTGGQLCLYGEAFRICLYVENHDEFWGGIPPQPFKKDDKLSNSPKIPTQNMKKKWGFKSSTSAIPLLDETAEGSLIIAEVFPKEIDVCTSGTMIGMAQYHRGP